MGDEYPDSTVLGIDRVYTLSYVPMAYTMSVLEPNTFNSQPYTTYLGSAKRQVHGR